MGVQCVALTITQAARLVDLDKTTILRAIKAGRISATRENPGKPWLVDTAELARVYSMPADFAAIAVLDVPDAAQSTADVQPRSAAAEVEIRELRASLADKDEQLRNLWQRFDAEAEERRRLTMILADLRTAPAAQGRTASRGASHVREAACGGNGDDKPLCLSQRRAG